MEPDIDGVVVVSGLPAGSVLDSSTVTFSGISTSDPLFNITMVQVRVTLDPGLMELEMLLTSITEDGGGTVDNV